MAVFPAAAPCRRLRPLTVHAMPNQGDMTPARVIRRQRMASMTCADYITSLLADIGITRIWGVTGDSLNGINDSLLRQGKIEFMHVRHEETGAFAAGAEAAATGKLAVCAGSCGPGNLHLINGLYDCHRNHVPVLAIASHIPSSEIGSQYFQETHPQELFRECSHYVELVSNPAQLPRIMERAIRTAVERRGVAVIVLPAMSRSRKSPQRRQRSTSPRPPRSRRQQPISNVWRRCSTRPKT